MYKWFIILLFPLVIGACATPGSQLLTDEAEERCLEILVTDDKLCNTTALWTYHSAVYKVINDARITAQPPLLKLDTYKSLVKRMDDVADLIESIDAGQTHPEQFSNAMNTVIRILVAESVLENSSDGIL